MIKQRLSKVIWCIALAISVFLHSSVISLGASEVQPTDYFPQLDLTSEWIQMRLQDTFTSESGGVIGSLRGSCIVNMSVYLEGGYVYTGEVTRVVTYTLNGGSNDILGNGSLSYVSVPSIEFFGGDSTVRASALYSWVSSEVINVFYRINFNNYYVPYSCTYQTNCNVAFDASIIGASDSGIFNHSYYVSSNAEDTAGFLSRYLYGDVDDANAIYNIGDQITNNQQIINQEQMQQQQQIADQQFQQSAQQHENLVNGFTDDTYNNNVSNAGNTVDSYISVESELMQSQHNQVNSYIDSNFDTGLINGYLPAVTACATWYSRIWQSFGNLNTAFVVVLSLGVAALVIGLRRKG